MKKKLLMKNSYWKKINEKELIKKKILKKIIKKNFLKMKEKWRKYLQYYTMKNK